MKSSEQTTIFQGYMDNSWKAKGWDSVLFSFKDRCLVGQMFGISQKKSPGRHAKGCVHTKV